MSMSTSFASPPRAILVIGYRIATWAIRMANTHPSARLTATDIHPPHLAPPVPPNFHFVPFNANDAHWLLPPAVFDFIHGRMITSGIHDWSRFLANCHHYLAPGGHLELLDVTHPFRAEKPTADDEATSAFIRFGYATEHAWVLRGINYRATATHGSQLAGLGFEDVQDELVKWLLGEWASSSREQEMGRLNKGNLEHFLRSAGVALLGPQNQDMVDDILRDLETNADSNRHYLAMNVVAEQTSCIGRLVRPDDGERQDQQQQKQQQPQDQHPRGGLPPRRTCHRISTLEGAAELMFTLPKINPSAPADAPVYHFSIHGIMQSYVQIRAENQPQDPAFFIQVTGIIGSYELGTFVSRSPSLPTAVRLQPAKHHLSYSPGIISSSDPNLLLVAIM
ncbi:S-adenosyl-L-methionine-dependent methyltransferase [Aspergillus affinis]|uniref:S-adenosyl-L-methionine-dependent methyltransferase n=1 Tax=Aspergillus affinis TaxID=1070780 RepID=UPI0022FF06CF|nr:S-adenosyl-L-methionine-dependent methyltransferase [Aspergillus affinis]KAI9036651.1 S-adenosyl-L-methionine-dependent methyltransferase [Aspergillus affinis]